MDYKITSRSIEDTMELAENIESEKFPGMIICLDGELGSGKTVFVKGFAKSLGIEENITSPTFNIVKEYQGTYFDIDNLGGLIITSNNELKTFYNGEVIKTRINETK